MNFDKFWRKFVRGCNGTDDFSVKYHRNFVEIDGNFRVKEKWDEWEGKNRGESLLLLVGGVAAAGGAGSAALLGCWGDRT